MPIPIPPLLKSKYFWVFSTISGSLVGAIGYDRFEAQAIHNSFLKEARVYGSLPLYSHQRPRTLGLFLISSDTSSHAATLQNFNKFAVDILTLAGIDYRWIIKLDGEDIKGKWDELARETNQPELMMEENKISIDLNDLRNFLIKPFLSRSFKIGIGIESGIQKDKVIDGGNCSESSNSSDKLLIWSKLETKVFPLLNFEEWPKGLEGFISLNQFTFDSLKEDLESGFKLEDSKLLIGSSPKSSNSKSLLSKLTSIWTKTNTNTNNNTNNNNNTLILLHQIPCSHSQSPLDRLARFLFGQRFLAQSIGQAAMKIVQDQERIQVPECAHLQFYQQNNNEQ